MELVEGDGPRRDPQGTGHPGLPLDDAIEYVRQACEALQYVHEQQIVHRDVKPQNLILGEDGVVLVDFGVARELSEQGRGHVGIGTPRFMAPEVFAGGTRLAAQRRLQPGRHAVDADRRQAPRLRGPDGQAVERRAGRVARARG